MDFLSGWRVDLVTTNTRPPGQCRSPRVLGQLGLLPDTCTEARGDVDGNGAPSFWGFVKPAGGSGLAGTFPGTTCVGTGVVAAGSGGNALEIPGPCDASSERTVF